MLVSAKPLLQRARQRGYAVGAFNFSNLEQLQATVAAAAAERSPVLVSTSEGAIRYASMGQLVAMATVAAKAIKVPVALHLDHGKDPNVVKLAIKSGYTSVMFDGSALPYAENVRQTRALVKLAHARRIPLEAELGVLAGIEDMVSAKQTYLTDPQQAKRFVELTGCDSIAVSIGTSHGVHKFHGAARLDFDRLAQIASLVRLPIVLHGASGVLPELVAKAERYGAKLGEAHGVDDASILRAIKLGVAKVNIDSDLRLAFTAAVREVYADHSDIFDPRDVLGPARQAMAEVVSQKVRLFGSAGRA